MAGIVACVVASCGTKEDSIAQLCGTTWQVVKINGEEMTYGEEPATMTFSQEEGKVYATTGCNIFNTDFTVGEDTIHIDTEKGQLTMMMCQDIEKEIKFMEAVGSGIGRYSIVDSTLSLIRSDGSVAFELVKGESFRTPLTEKGSENE